MCRGAVTGTKLDVAAKLVIHFWLAALGTQGVVCDPLGSAVGSPGTLLAQRNLPSGHEKNANGHQESPPFAHLHGVAREKECCQHDLRA